MVSQEEMKRQLLHTVCCAENERCGNSTSKLMLLMGFSLSDCPQSRHGSLEAACAKKNKLCTVLGIIASTRTHEESRATRQQ